MEKFSIRQLIPNLHQEFVLVVFLMIPYAIQQLPWPLQHKLIIDSVFFLLLVVWLIKVFTQERSSRPYKGFIVLITGLSLFVAGLYSAIIYYFDISIIILESFYPFIYLFFPIWVMLEGGFMLFLLGFDSSSKNYDLEKKIIAGPPNLGDFLMVTIATVFLVVLGDWVLALPWFLNVCVVFTVNLIIINQFGHQPRP